MRGCWPWHTAEFSSCPACRKPEVMQRFGSEALCAAELEGMRWSKANFQQRPRDGRLQMRPKLSTGGATAMER